MKRYIRTSVSNISSESYTDRLLIASDPSTPDAILRQMFSNYEEESPYVLAEIACNPNTPIDILEQLAIDEDENIRVGVAQNINAPKHLLLMLSSDPDWLTRKEAKSALERFNV